MGVAIDKKRNVAIIGHGGAGKTVLSEAILYIAGAINRMGTIEDGNTVSDHDPEEIKRKYSITSAVLPFDFEDHHFTLIDCPGYRDFLGESTSALNVVDSAIIVVNGSMGVEPQTRIFWETCEKLHLPRLIFISGLDKENADWDNAISSCRNEFGKTVAPLCITIGEHHDLKGVINVLLRKAYMKEGDKIVEKPVPDDYKEATEAARADLVESIVELDDELMMRYMDDDTISTDELEKAMLDGILHGKFCPAVGGSGKETVGIRNLLEIIIHSMPHPGFHEKLHGSKPDGSEESRPPSEDAPLTARVFKVTSEGQVGDVFWMRVWSGKLKNGDTVLNSSTDEQEKIGNLILMRGKERKDVNEVGAGDIVATMKLKHTKMGNTLTAKDSPFILDKIEYRRPVAYEKVEVDDHNDLEKVISTLNVLTSADPTLRLVQDEETKEQVLYGMGPLHLDVARSQVKKRVGVDIKWEKPRIRYRETITGSGNAQGKYKKQSGGRGKYGDCHIRLEARERGAGFEFLDEVVGGVVPGRFIPAIEKGIVEAMVNGPLSGSKVIDIKAAVYDGSSHSVDSDELSFKMAAQMGFRSAFEQARPILLEPIYNVTVQTPDEYTGDVMADLNTRRGRVGGMDQVGNVKEIKAQVPLAEMYQYINTLRSMTQGQGSFEMEFASYEQVPSNVQGDIIKAHQANQKAEAH
ncbi:MAG: elongation factor G [Planctomycetales bacterium]|nr:elongation factor G [bacterium]UNM07884.1 MAG: elongation factor G [Planctomycetales bacterium]